MEQMKQKILAIGTVNQEIIERVESIEEVIIYDYYVKKSPQLQFELIETSATKLGSPSPILRIE
jgi:hypothetical protein